MYSSMLMPRFDFEAPTSVEGALALLAGTRGEARLLAGGTDLLVKIKHGVISPRLVGNRSPKLKIPNISSTFPGASSPRDPSWSTDSISLRTRFKSSLSVSSFNILHKTDMYSSARVSTLTRSFVRGAKLDSFSLINRSSDAEASISGDGAEDFPSGPTGTSAGSPVDSPWPVSCTKIPFRMSRR